ALIFHYIPSYFWKNRQIMFKELRLFCMFYYGLFSWIHSDFFFILALGFTKFRKKSIANSCGKQAMKTIGTFPLLILATEFSNQTNKTDSEDSQSIKNQQFSNEFDFLYV